MTKTLVEICNGTGEKDQLRRPAGGADHQPDRPRCNPCGNSDLVESGATVAHKHLADFLGRIEAQQQDTRSNSKETTSWLKRSPRQFVVVQQQK